MAMFNEWYHCSIYQEPFFNDIKCVGPFRDALEADDKVRDDPQASWTKLVKTSRIQPFKKHYLLKKIIQSKINLTKPNAFAF